MPPAFSASLSVEPLQDWHSKAPFTCGVSDLDSYFLKAAQDAKRRVAATFVLIDQDQVVVGYYTLSAYGIRLAELPPEISKKLPKYPVLPATLLGQLAISKERHGQRLGQFLLMDALRRSWENTRSIGSIGVLVEAYDENAERFYRHHEFRSLPGYANRLFLSMSTVGKLFPV